MKIDNIEPQTEDTASFDPKTGRLSLTGVKRTIYECLVEVDGEARPFEMILDWRAKSLDITMQKSGVPAFAVAHTLQMEIRDRTRQTAPFKNFAAPADHYTECPVTEVEHLHGLLHKLKQAKWFELRTQGSPPFRMG
jgi:hypothetical protein